MGGNNSKKVAKEVVEATKVVEKVVEKEVVKVQNSEEAKLALVQTSLDNQMSAMKKEVDELPQHFSEDQVKVTIAYKGDVTLLRYSNLENPNDILKNISTIFDGFPAAHVIMDEAQKLIHAMHSTESLKEILRWQSKCLVTKQDGQNVGIEAHYKLKLLEETNGIRYINKKKVTVFVIAYKCYAHLLQLTADEVPDLSKLNLKSLKF